jgi:hypothetical protein
MPGARQSETVLRANDRRLQPDLRRARGKFKSFGTGVQRDLKKSFGGVRAAFGKVAGLLGIVGIAQLGREILSFEKQMTRLQIRTGASDKQFGALRQEIARVAGVTGVSRSELIGAVASLEDMTTSLETAKGAFESVAKVSQITGASLDEVSKVAATMAVNFGLSGEQIEAGFSALLATGQRDIAGIASTMDVLGPKFKALGITGVEGVAKMGAAMTVLGKTFTEEGKAGAALSTLITQIGSKGKQKALKNLGIRLTEIDPKTGIKRMRNFDEIITDISKSKKKFDILSIFKGDSREALATLAETPGALEDITDAAKGANNVQRDFAAFAESSAGKIQAAWGRIQLAIAEAFTPERVAQFTTQLLKVLDAAVKIVDAMFAIAEFFGKVNKAVQIAPDIKGKTVEEARQAFANRPVTGHFETMKERADREVKEGKVRTSIVGRSVEEELRERVALKRRGAALAAAETIARVSTAATTAKAVETLVNVKITVDEQGLLKAEANKKRQERRDRV